MDGFYPDILTLPMESREHTRPPARTAILGAPRHPRGINLYTTGYGLLS
jgi:hypothetical protein